MANESCTSPGCADKAVCARISLAMMALALAVTGGAALFTGSRDWLVMFGVFAFFAAINGIFALVSLRTGAKAFERTGRADAR